jgi:hypothetical protein
MEEQVRRVRDHEVGLNQLNSVDPELESACFQPLNLKRDILVSNFAFKCDLHRYNEVGQARLEEAAKHRRQLADAREELERVHAERLRKLRAREVGGGCTS